jgi:hypothetical protein
MNLRLGVEFKGPPGCGKSYAMGVIRKALEAQGWIVYHERGAAMGEPHEFTISKRVRRDERGRVAE